VVKWLPLVLVVLAAFYLYCFDGWKDLVRGRNHRMAQEMFPPSMNMPSDLDNVDEARVYLLAAQREDATPQEEFTLGRWGESYDCFGSITIKGEELNQFLGVYCSQQVSDLFPAMCHGPVYGLRLYEEGRLVREVAVCWSCSNFSYSVLPGVTGGSGFNSRSKQAVDLFEYCSIRLPFKGSQAALEKFRKGDR